MAETKIQKIARLNDALRKYGRGGEIHVTQGVHALGHDARVKIVSLIARFDTFTKDDDPYGERDMGNITYQNQKIFWKIDYYDAEKKYGSEDPADPDKTTRILTIFFASEY